MNESKIVQKHNLTKALNAKIVQHSFKEKQSGITLIALVVTIIVLLILAGIAISLTIGDKGIFKRAEQAVDVWDKATVEEDLAMIIGEYPLYSLTGGTSTFEDYLLEKGADSVTDNGDGTLNVKYKGYEFVVDKESYEILSGEELGGVKPEIKVTKKASSDNKKVTITVEITNEVGEVNSITLTGPNGEEITGSLNGKTATFEVSSNGNYTAKAEATTEGYKRTASSVVEVNEIEVEFSTESGKIEVVWLDTNNNVIGSPNSPAEHLGGMHPVYWTGDSAITGVAGGSGTYSEVYDEDDSEKSNPNNIWYNYASIEGTEDNRTSRWANAKDSNGSYFVWVPRYAYRITYYNDEGQVTGYYDGRGMVNTQGQAITQVSGTNIDGSLDEGIETVTSNGKSYIVHPAFMDDSANSFNNGGWDDDLAGIWVGKYEMSRETNGSHTETSGSSTGNLLTNDTIKAVSKPGVSSWRYITIGNSYTNSYNYNRDMESHLMKNSEWGAVAYLTHSQYGRNGYEIDINNSSSYITGNGGGSTSASQASGVTNAYDTANGVKASSTGNIYGIYDLSGGAYEYVAAFDTLSDSSYITNYGSSFASKGETSTKYATAYSNGTSTYYGTKIYEVGKIGDATKEVYTGNSYRNWNNDYSNFLYSLFPFFRRGGYYYGGSDAGVFGSGSSYGRDDSVDGFRVVLGK